MTADEKDTPLAVRRTGRFGIVQAAVVWGTDLSPNARLTYTGLVLFAGGTGQAWPSATTLAAGLGLARSSVYKALDELEAAGVIRRERRTSEAGADRPTLVTILDERGDGSVRETDTSVRHTDGSVRHTDTTSVRHTDTNKEQRTRSAAPRQTPDDPPRPPMGGRAVEGAEATRSFVEATYKRRSLPTDHAAGAARARHMLEEALASARAAASEEART